MLHLDLLLSGAGAGVLGLVVRLEDLVRWHQCLPHVLGVSAYVRSFARGRARAGKWVMRCTGTIEGGVHRRDGKRRREQCVDYSSK